MNHTISEVSGCRQSARRTNHVAFFHSLAIDPSVREALYRQLREEDLPNNCYYGDGSRIEESVIREIRAVYAELAVAFRWQRSDLLMLDNMLAAHGRNPYTGPRRIVVGMSEAVSADDFQERVEK